MAIDDNWYDSSAFTDELEIAIKLRFPDAAYVSSEGNVLDFIDPRHGMFRITIEEAFLTVPND